MIDCCVSVCGHQGNRKVLSPSPETGRVDGQLARPPKTVSVLVSFTVISGLIYVLIIIEKVGENQIPTTSALQHNASVMQKQSMDTAVCRLLWNQHVSIRKRERLCTMNKLAWILSPSFALEMLIVNSEGIQSPY